MRGTVDSIKERLDIVDVVSNYLKLEKTGQNFKGRCPFHNEKTASFFVSHARQTYYCFGCGAKGDMFTLVQELEGIDFKGALNLLADRAGVEIEYSSGESKGEKNKLYLAIEDATTFFENNLHESKEALKYLESRGITPESIKEWRLGFAPNEWRLLFNYLTGLGHSKDTLIRVGLIKQGDDAAKEAYDVFRGRIIFPISDASGKVIAFSGRALDKDTVPKYLNTPETSLFRKGEVLYGLDKAKDEIRKKNFAILVEGQIDLVMAHQIGIKNTVASSGTAFTEMHLERLKKLSTRILLAFDGDEAGEKAAEKSTLLGLSLGMEVKVASLPKGKDPADLASESSEALKDVLKKATHSIERMLDRILEGEKDKRKLGKLIEKKVLPVLTLIDSAIEKAHFISLISKKSGIREEVLWEDLKKAKTPQVLKVLESEPSVDLMLEEDLKTLSLRERIEARLAEIDLWQKEFPEASTLSEALKKEEVELRSRLEIARIDEERSALRALLRADEGNEELVRQIHDLDRKMDVEKRKMM